MKKSKVSSDFYEGKRKRSIEEKEISSRNARLNARARKNSYRGRILHYLASTKQWMMNNFTNKNQHENESIAQTEKDHNMKANVGTSDKEAKAEAADMDKEGEEHEKSKMVEINVNMEKWGEEGEWWEEWPLCWSYEEKLMWGGFGSNLQDFFLKKSNLQDDLDNQDDVYLGNIWNSN